MAKEIAYFGAGCFWGVEYVFSRITGVLKTEAGYMGGNESFENPTYEDVCTGKTRHAEVVKITFDNKKTSYEKLLEIFWKIHDSTSLNRQGPDIGTQYRSIILFTNEDQKRLAEESKRELQKKIRSKIVTEIVKAEKFHKAEEYHQKYGEKHPGSCHVPNLASLR